MTSPSRTDWPGRSVRSRDRPLRLLSSPSTAVRWAIGVVPGGIRVTVCGTSTVSIVSLVWAFCSGAPVGPQAPSASETASKGSVSRGAMPQSGVQA